MKLGVPRETREGERRVATTPEVAKKLIAKGLHVRLEHGAGAEAGYHDDDARRTPSAGAEFPEPRDPVGERRLSGGRTVFAGPDERPRAGDASIASGSDREATTGIALHPLRDLRVLRG